MGLNGKTRGWGKGKWDVRSGGQRYGWVRWVEEGGLVEVGGVEK